MRTSMSILSNYPDMWLEKMLFIGIRAGDDKFKKEQIISANRGALICVFIGLLSSLASSFFVPKPYIYIPLGFSISYLSTLLYNYWGFYILGGINSWLISLFLFFWLAGAYGEESNAYLLFIIAEMVAVFNLDIRNSKLIMLVISLPIILSVISYLTNFSLFLIPTLSSESKEALNPILFFTVIISGSVSMLLYARRVQASMIKLEESEQSLREKYAELDKMHTELQDTNEELKKTNEELDKFVYSVSHDLRAPITSVMGLVDLCADNKENIDMYLELQRKSINKLDNFIKDILHYARNSRLPIIPVALDINKVILEVFESQAYGEAAEAMQLSIKIEGNGVIYTDEFRLNIILANLISNSIRYRRLSAEKSYIQFEIKCMPQHLDIKISDNGIGINEKYLPNIFQMFYRANKNSIGSGLGLYIVKEAIAKLEGKVEASSIEGVGTTFSLKIPSLKS